MTEHASDSAIQDFLGSVERKLGGMPRERRADELRELRQHLDLLSAAYRAQGLTPQAADAAAIDRFGRAEHLGRELGAAARRAAGRHTPRYYAAFWLGYSALILVVNLAILAVIDAPLDLAGRLEERLRTLALPALILPAVFVVLELWRQRRATRLPS